MRRLSDNITGKNAIYDTLVNVEKKGNNLIVDFYSSHCSFNSYSDKFNDDLFKGDVVEIFVKTEKMNSYLEVELAPNGTLFIGEIFNDGNHRILNMLKNKGIAAFTEKNNCNWNAKLIIPIKEYEINEEIYFNAFRIETDGERSEKHLFALNPTKCETFHKIESFIKLN